MESAYITPLSAAPRRTAFVARRCLWREKKIKFRSRPAFPNGELLESFNVRFAYQHNHYISCNYTGVGIDQCLGKCSGGNYAKPLSKLCTFVTYTTHHGAHRLASSSVIACLWGSCNFGPAFKSSVVLTGHLQQDLKPAYFSSPTVIILYMLMKLIL